MLNGVTAAGASVVAPESGVLPGGEDEELLLHPRRQAAVAYAKKRERCIGIPRLVPSGGSATHQRPPYTSAEPQGEDEALRFRR
jgi:hypothetical protein